jgi:hypothetical protein
MKRHSRREQVMIGLCVLIALFIGGPMLWQIVMPGGPSGVESQRRLEAAKSARKANAAALGKLEAAMERLAARLPPAALAAGAAAELDQRAGAVGIRLREVKPLAPKLVEGATVVPLQLTFSAPFPQAARFLTRLRAEPGRLAVDRAVIAATTTDSDLVSVNLRVEVFSLTEEKQGKIRGQS